MSGVVKHAPVWGTLEVDDIYVSDFQTEGTVTMRLSQTVTLKVDYPSKQVENSHQNNPFNVKDFGFKAKPFENKSVRKAFLDVPEGTTPAKAKKVMKQEVATHGEENCRIYRVLSSQPVLTDGQERMIAKGKLALNKVAARQLVIYEDTGMPIIHEGKVQYRATFYTNTGVDDQDTRSLPEYWNEELEKMVQAGEAGDFTTVETPDLGM
jgi:hypothetical protein